MVGFGKNCKIISATHHTSKISDFDDAGDQYRSLTWQLELSIFDSWLSGVVKRFRQRVILSRSKVRLSSSHIVAYLLLCVQLVSKYLRNHVWHGYTHIQCTEWRERHPRPALSYCTWTIKAALMHIFNNHSCERMLDFPNPNPWMVRIVTCARTAIGCSKYLHDKWS